MKRHLLRRDPRVGQQIVDHRLHPPRGALHPLQVLQHLRREALAGSHRHAIAEELDLAERFLQVVGRHGGEFLQRLVAPLELRRALLHLHFQIFSGPSEDDFAPMSLRHIVKEDHLL